MKLEIELRQHRGIVQTHLGDYEVDLPQYMVLAHNRDEGTTMHVGYLGHDPAAVFNGSLLLGELPEALQKEIVAGVSAAAGRDVTARIPPPEVVFSMPMEVEDDDADAE